MPTATIHITDIEYLCSGLAQKGDKNKVVLTLRLNPPDFKSNNLALTHEQAIRLRDDLNTVLADPKMKKIRKKK